MRRRGARADRSLYHVTAGSQTRYEIDGKPVTGVGERVRVPRHRGRRTPNTSTSRTARSAAARVAGLPMQTVDFTATMPVIHPEYTHRVRDFTSTTPRKTLGIVRPVISPDGTQIAFAAVGDIYVMPASGGAAVNLTKDAALDTDPSWSPDGSSLVYSSDRDSPHLQLWIRDMKSGVSRKVTNITTQPQGASFSPDGKRIVFFNVDGMWRVAEMSILDLDSGQHHEDPRIAAAAGHADVVARRQAHRARRHRADDGALPRRHQPGPDDLGDRRRREVVRADPAAVDRLARRRRAGVVAGRHEDGGDLRRRAVGVAGGAERRAAGAAAPRHLRERARAELAGRFAPHPLSVARSAPHRRHRDRRNEDRAVQPDVDAGDSRRPASSCTPASSST